MDSSGDNYANVSTTFTVKVGINGIGDGVEYFQNIPDH